MSFELDVNVYSVVSIAPDRVESVTKAYLYDHTVVEIGFDLPSIVNTKVTAVILKTTNTVLVDGVDDVGENVRDALRRAHFLAQYQIDRFASGMYPGRVCGSLGEATDYVTSALVR